MWLWPPRLTVCRELTGNLYLYLYLYLYIYIYIYIYIYTYINTHQPPGLKIPTAC